MTSTTVEPPSPSNKRPWSQVDQDHAPSPFENNSINITASPLNSSVSIQSNVNAFSRQPSPAPSTTSTLTSITATPPPPSLNGGKEVGLAPPTAKRRKLTKVEKDQRELEKAEKRSKREQEKQVKDEERRVKNEAKEERQRQKELQKQQKEEELRRKEKAQPKINFFLNNKVATSSSAPEAQAAGPLPETENPVLLKSDYQQTFLPFEYPSNVVCAPENVYSWDLAATESMSKKISAGLVEERDSSQVCSGLADLINSITQRKSQCSSLTVREIITNISRADSWEPGLRALALGNLARIPVRFIRHSEDVRPPYVGTHSKLSPLETGNIARNPFKHCVEELQYDEDSELEWVEPDEGEDLNSECDSDAESIGDEAEMDEFLDDEENAQSRMKYTKLVSELTPSCTGLCFEDEKGKNAIPAMQEYKMEFLLDGVESLDPWSTLLWADYGTQDLMTNTTKSSSMCPPRLPLQSRTDSVVNRPAMLGLNNATSSIKSSKIGKVPSQELTGELLQQFKDAVDGSELNKVGLLAVLKKRFPKITNEVIKTTLGTIASRQGAKEADKRWIIHEMPTFS